MLMICCGNEYCQECIIRLFQAAVKDELSFPPRCCLTSVLAVEQVAHFLPQDVLNRYLERDKEWASPYRVYCHKPTCSRFIGHREVKDGGVTCPSCGSTTCAVCKAAAHEGECLNEDPDTASLMELAREAGYKMPLRYTFLL
ncbi:MAG: hypothetical protein Q9207_003029 [Kuettlingeria erythrocarpa]